MFVDIRLKRILISKTGGALYDLWQSKIVPASFADAEVFNYNLEQEHLHLVLTYLWF